MPSSLTVEEQGISPTIASAIVSSGKDPNSVSSQDELLKIEKSHKINTKANATKDFYCKVVPLPKNAIISDIEKQQWNEIEQDAIKNAIHTHP